MNWLYSNNSKLSNTSIFKVSIMSKVSKWKQIQSLQNTHSVLELKSGLLNLPGNTILRSPIPAAVRVSLYESEGTSSSFLLLIQKNLCVYEVVLDGLIDHGDAALFLAAGRLYGAKTLDTSSRLGHTVKA